MRGKPPVAYWDTNVFISLFRGCSDRDENEAEGIRHWYALADQREAQIVTSAITYAEVMDFHLKAPQYRAFDAFMVGAVDVKDATVGVMRRVKEIRDHYNAAPRRKGQKHKLCVPDAIHIATALIFDCDEFHTFDKRARRRCTGILSLGPLPDGSITRICTPEAPPGGAQPELWDSAP